MKARVKAKNCKIKVTTYFNEYYLNFNADDVLEIEVDEKVTDFVLLVKRMREARHKCVMQIDNALSKLYMHISIKFLESRMKSNDNEE